MVFIGLLLMFFDLIFVLIVSPDQMLDGLLTKFLIMAGLGYSLYQNFKLKRLKEKYSYLLS